MEFLVVEYVNGEIYKTSRLLDLNAVRTYLKLRTTPRLTATQIYVEINEALYQSLGVQESKWHVPKTGVSDE